jgi:sulfoxide reductase heme-binding subunit YedZ
VAKVLVPFASAGYKPIAVGVGQLGFYLWAIIALSFYIRKKIGSKTWRVIHFGSFASFLFALLHGISSGTDTATNWGRTIYWVTGVILLYLVIYRVLHARDIKAEKKARLANIPPRLPVN